MWFWFNYFGRHGWLQVWTNSPDVFQTTSGLDLKKIIGGLGQCSVNECDLFFFHTKIGACFEPPQVSKAFWKAFTELRLPIARRFLSMSIRSKKKKKKKSVRPEDEANTIYLFISLCHRILFPGLWNKHQKITFPPQLSVPDIGSHLPAEEPSMRSFSLFGGSLNPTLVALEVSSHLCCKAYLCVDGLVPGRPSQHPRIESFYFLNPSNLSCKE